MNHRVLLRVLRVVAIVALTVPIPAFAQAAAESALTNALSSSSTVSAGSALSRSLNQSGKQLGNRIQERTESPVQSATQRRSPAAQLKKPGTAALAAGPVHSASSQPISGISIQGGETTCPAITANTQPAGATTTLADCHRSPSAPKPAADADMYKSFVMLPAPK